MHGSGKWTCDAAKNAVLFVTMQQNVFAAGAANYFVTPEAGDSLGAIVPEQNFAVASDQIHSGLQAVQNGSKDAWILKFRHLRGLGVPFEFFIGKRGRTFSVGPERKTSARTSV